MTTLKQRLFSLYIGQEVAVTSAPENISYPNYPFDIGEKALYLAGMVNNKVVINRIAEEVHDRFNQCALLLRPLSDIKDAEAVHVARIILGTKIADRYRTPFSVTRDFSLTGWPYVKVHHPKNVYELNIDCALVLFSLYNMGEVETDAHDMKTVYVIDYLRSCGFALPIYHDGDQYSIDKLVELGLIKLK